MKVCFTILIFLITFDFGDLEITKGYKSISYHNPLVTQKYLAEPGAMEYENRVYIYGSNDGITSEVGENPEINTYININTISIISSPDLVNWEDHGTIQVAGKSGSAKWAHNSWSPSVCHKKIKGKEKFFLYFSDNSNGIGVLTSDSPTGPFEDPIGGALINRKTEGCENVTWIVDPDCYVNDDEAYLVFGGGIPDDEEDNPKTARIVKLGEDMISIDGNPKVIDAPYFYKDNGINKVGNDWIYSFCTSYTGGRFGNGRTIYMSSKEALGPYSIIGICFNNPSDFVPVSGVNNHHSIIQFKKNWYIFYHTELLNKFVTGVENGYRTTHLDFLPDDGSPFGRAKGSLQGVKQTDNVNAFESHSAAMMAWQGGIIVNGSGHTTVSYRKNDWTGVSQVDFGDGAKNITISASSKNGCKVKIVAGQPDGDEIGSIDVEKTGENNFEEFSTEVEVSGIKNIFFVASGDVTIDTWEFIN